MKDDQSYTFLMATVVGAIVAILILLSFARARVSMLEKEVKELKEQIQK